ncbi:hypothetical protein GJ496_003735 [Pomphorhynchus laevis]|nr:hypothetical protein GJ496_003735 [Pomphorhynchus laevis]
MLICTYIIAVNVNIVSLNSVAKFTKQESESFSSLDNGKRVNYPKLFMSSNGNYPVINSKVIFSDKNNNTNDSKPQLFPKDADKNFINGTYMYSKINNLTVHVYQQNSTDERN